ncbi:hypothetical protein CBM2587_B10124 [Cupriavidus taiwanensis]|uniref:Uncharacterized protein n=1 Tax=Cupriavidus taiwanensis TaxID=164546 RepID=A0A975X5Z9_9BURK|nr:hypothetical protein CBM2587_B10124 [Cupriavidus taiwanensis]
MVDLHGAFLAGFLWHYGRAGEFFRAPGPDSLRGGCGGIFARGLPRIASLFSHGYST